MLESGLTSLLLACEPLAALVGARIYPVSMPADNESFPSVTYQVVSASPEVALDRTLLQTKRVQIDAWSFTYADCKNVQLAISNLVIGYSGLLPDGTTYLLVAMPGVELDDFESASRLYRTMCEYEITFRS